MEIRPLIEAAAKLRASDIHLMESSPPSFRVDGDLIPVNLPPVTHEQMEGIVKELVPESMNQQLKTRRSVDVGFQHKDVTRVRIVVYFERGRLRLVLRLIPLKVPSFEELGLPPVVVKITTYNKGMVLVTGPTGSGKSTTLAAVIDYMNTSEKISITTIEDPIEFVHGNKRAMVTQREVGKDVTDFTSGVVQAMRQDPDVILIGEMRDIETMRTAIKAAETGHYVLSTLHTTNAVQTVERVIGTFPETEHALVREQLANNLQASVTQSLVRRAEGKGRAAALEVMIVNKTVAKLISDNRLKDIYSVMQSGEDGMQTFDQALANLVKANTIKEEEGAVYATDVFAFKRYVKGMSSSSDRGGIIAGFGS